MFGDVFPQVVRALDCCAQSSDSGRLLPPPTAGNFAEENTMSHPGAEASAAKAPKAPATSVVRGIIDERCESNASVGQKAPATTVVQGTINEYRVLNASVAYAAPTTQREGIYTVECQSPRSPAHRATSPTTQREVIYTVECQSRKLPAHRATVPTTQREGIYTVECQSPELPEHRARLAHAADGTNAESTVLIPLTLAQEAPNYATSMTQAKYLTGTGNSFHDAGKHADSTNAERAVHKVQMLSHKVSSENQDQGNMHEWCANWEQQDEKAKREIRQLREELEKCNKKISKLETSAQEILVASMKEKIDLANERMEESRRFAETSQKFAERILQIHETVLGKLTCAGEVSTSKQRDRALAPESSILIAAQQQMLKRREEAANAQQYICVQTEQQLNTPTISNAREIDDLCMQIKQDEDGQHIHVLHESSGSYVSYLQGEECINVTEDVKERTDMRPNVCEQRASCVQANANEQRASTELESRSDLAQGQCGEVYHQHAVSADAQQFAKHQANVGVNQLQHQGKESDGYQLQMNKHQEENNESQQLDMHVTQAQQGKVKQHPNQTQITNELCAEDACTDDLDQATDKQPEREQQTEKECEHRDENKMVIEMPIPVESQSLERARHAKPILRRSPCVSAGGKTAQIINDPAVSNAYTVRPRNLTKSASPAKSWRRKYWPSETMKEGGIDVLGSYKKLIEVVVSGDILNTNANSANPLETAVLTQELNSMYQALIANARTIYWKSDGVAEFILDLFMEQQGDDYDPLILAFQEASDEVWADGIVHGPDWRPWYADEDFTRISSSAWQEVNQEFFKLPRAANYIDIGAPLVASVTTTPTEIRSVQDAASDVKVETKNTSLLQRTIELENYADAQQLQDLGPDVIKQELQRMGIKCGGTLEERARRLWSTKGFRITCEIDAEMRATTNLKSGMQRESKHRKCEHCGSTFASSNQLYRHISATHPNAVPDHQSYAHFPRLISSKLASNKAEEAESKKPKQALDADGWHVVGRSNRSKT